MKVVLDSNIVISDFWMRSPNFKILLESSKNGDIELYIPQVVLDEVINKFSQRIENSISEINNELIKFEKDANITTGFSLSDKLIETTKTNYTKNLDKLIKASQIGIIDYPEASHKLLAKKAMLKLKPFNSNEKGYRDSLIWENVKSLVSPEHIEIPATPEVVFITNNHKDFTSDDKSLHKDLIKELRDENLTGHSVVVYSSLNEYNDQVSKLFFKQAKIFEGKLMNNEFLKFELKSLLDNYLFKYFVGGSLSNYYCLAPYANDNPTVSNISEDFSIDNTSVKKLNSKEYIVDVQFKVESEIDYFIDKSDYWISDQLDVSLVEGDWNDHVVLVSRLVDIPIEMSLIINSELVCTSIEINKVDGDYK
ncbi:MULTISPECIES: PIN domain-containing protein [unclassified Paraflavitalea]|uniref:PIN domain-containing protein n=1 Tax=unclassified Paraflavitalea TaxID=2798305 RepID=UPI003D32AF94